MYFRSLRFVVPCIALLAVVGISSSALADAPGPGAPAAEALGWRIGCQLWSFNKFSFSEAIDKTASLGLKYAEAFPGQRLCTDLPEKVTFIHSMSEEHRALAKEKLEKAGITLLSYGVVSLPTNESKAREVFEFAKDMGIGTIASEPLKKNMPLVSKLADEYGIRVAIHNHPEPSLYWNYTTVLEAVEGLSPLVGACADTGHWPRSGIDALEAVKALEGRLISFHLKDLMEFGNKEAHDVIWGTGICDVKGILTEIVRQEMKDPMFFIEYEYNWDNNVPDIAACVAYFNEVAEELAAD
ncbi:MAG: sugar phosphate isomerase/epimerase [Candidatus Hydrogenedens sp.]|nr:sugar phosphate isomerase/epimerase [Candidatus Hydrogenedens sp.]